MLTYKIEEVKPEGFESVINEGGKVYHFNVFSNAAATKFNKKYGVIPLSVFFSKEATQNGTYNEFIGFMAYLLLCPEDKKDFKNYEDFDEKLQPYYLKHNDFDSKILKCLSICIVSSDDDKKEEGAPKSEERFQENKAGRSDDKTSKKSWLERIGLLVFKSKANANKAI